MTGTVRWDQGADGIVVLTLDDPNQSANTMNADFRDSFRRTVDRLESEKDSITGVVLTSAKKSFFAGGDLKALRQFVPEQAEELAGTVDEIKKHLRRLETLGRPVVAAIDGAALGGGLELTLATHHRIATNRPGTLVGFPEVTLGMLPGGGGIVRTVRMVGVETAMENWLVRGQRHAPAKALELGLVDELVSTVDELVPRAKEWINAHPGAVQPWDVNGFRIPGGTPAGLSWAATLRKQLNGAPMPAPRAILAAAVEGAQVGFDTASRIETRYFVHLVTGQVAKNMIKAYFFDVQHIKAGGSRPGDAFAGVVNDSRGFFTSRLIAQFLGEAVAAVGEGVEPASIEQAGAQAGYSAPPLQLMDELTLTAGGIGHTHASEAVLARMIDDFGRPGRFAGAGFYDYENGERVRIWPGLRTAFNSGSRRIPFIDLQERMLFAEALEAVKCFDEGVLTSVPEANIGSLFGIGFPPWTGGVIHYVNQYPGGLPGFVARARELAQRYGDHFLPPESLVGKAMAGEIRE
ncbi:enoyl-CoA hydratase-related protein [Amycolatopsis sp. GM8]|uniref:enoyl-CoA hydratase-related protein n=1 Tax=Amycolatopsis sp. GM8 TaxID=2896530 RepID=UPI00271464F0|nr:enoyl-CoA hydratase-related protein [Amycolatopsis sp. GM8]